MLSLNNTEPVKETQIQSVLTAFWKAFYILLSVFKSYSHLLLGSKMSKPYKTSLENFLPSKNVRRTDKTEVGQMPRTRIMFLITIKSHKNNKHY